MTNLTPQQLLECPPLTKKQQEFLQARYEAAEEGRGEYLAPADNYTLEDCWQANHYKLNYRTTSMLLMGWEHYIGGNPADLGIAALDVARDFIRPIHPYWNWALSPASPEQIDRDDELGDAHEEASSEFERLFWIHWECWVEADLPPEIQKQQAEETARYRLQQDQLEVEKIQKEIAYIQSLPTLEPDPLDIGSATKLKKATTIADQMLTILHKAEPKLYPRLTYDERNSLQAYRKQLNQLRTRKTYPQSIEQTRNRIMQEYPDRLELRGYLGRQLIEHEAQTAVASEPNGWIEAKIKQGIAKLIGTK